MPVGRAAPTLLAQRVEIATWLLSWRQMELMPGVPMNMDALPNSQKASSCPPACVISPVEAFRVPNRPCHSVAAPALGCRQIL